MTTISDFSSEYFLIDPRVVEYPGESVICPQDMYEGLTRYVANPHVRLNEEHYRLYAEAGVPADTLAAPKAAVEKDGQSVLLAKNPRVLEQTFTDGEA
jgi:hypothetical protein